MASNFDNVKRTLTSLEKAIERLARQNFYNRSQWPELMITIEESLNDIRLWLDCHALFDGLHQFYTIIIDAFQHLCTLINQLSEICKPKSGKKQVSKKRREKARKNLSGSINSMTDSLNDFFQSSRENENDVAIAIDEGLQESFMKNIIQKFNKKIRNLVSGRGSKTCVFPWSDPESYLVMVKDKAKYRMEVVNKFSKLVDNKGHKSSCKGPKKYVLCGSRSNPRQTVMIGGKKVRFQIRLLQCKNCKQKFSLLPSFLPREKNFGIDIIGNVSQGMCFFSQSIQGSLTNLQLLGKRAVKSRQTILNWIRWMGTHHPTVNLIRAGIKGSGYLQEDEGFEKEPNLRTYTVIMVDPENMLVWHADYLDHVDEAHLQGSFEDFFKKISFKILGVTKDKWQASTNALKAVFKGIWIGYCHRHCLKKFYKALCDYQKNSKCSQKEVNRLYKIFKKILTESTSKANLEAKLRAIKDEAFNHPALAIRIKELKKNAAHYTCHKNREGIRPTTSLVDNYLKQVKRKLNQVESFRDQAWASLFFRAQANTRNFLPFGPGAKNAHKSPFMLAGGQTYGLPWMQVMNVHDAFLFTNGTSYNYVI